MSVKNVDLLDLAAIRHSDIVDAEVVLGIVTVGRELAYKAL